MKITSNEAVSTFSFQIGKPENTPHWWLIADGCSKRDVPFSRGISGVCGVTLTS